MRLLVSIRVESSSGNDDRVDLQRTTHQIDQYNEEQWMFAASSRARTWGHHIIETLIEQTRLEHILPKKEFCELNDSSCMIGAIAELYHQNERPQLSPCREGEFCCLRKTDRRGKSTGVHLHRRSGENPFGRIWGDVGRSVSEEEGRVEWSQEEEVGGR